MKKDDEGEAVKEDENPKGGRRGSLFPGELL